MALFYGTSVSLIEQQKPAKAKYGPRRPGRGIALLNWLFGRKERAPRLGRSAPAETCREPAHPDYLRHFQFPPH